MQEQQIAAFADDRHARRNLVVACSAADGDDDDDAQEGHVTATRSYLTFGQNLVFCWFTNFRVRFSSSLKSNFISMKE